VGDVVRDAGGREREQVIGRCAFSRYNNLKWQEGIWKRSRAWEALKIFPPALYEAADRSVEPEFLDNERQKPATLGKGY
jgi:hypothetical protein